MFFDTSPPGTADLSSVLVAPLTCDGLSFGAMLIYGRVNEAELDEAELEYWTTASTLVGLSLHWRALRNKLAKTLAT